MKQPKPWVKPVLELGPVVLFFVIFMLFREDSVHVLGRDYSGFVFATLVFIPVLVISTLLLWWLTGKLAPMQIATLVLVLVFGGMSVWLDDPRFFKMKPTMIYLLFAGLLGYSLIAGRNWLGAVLGEALPLTETGWLKLTRRMAAMFLALAVANELIWRLMSETSWVWFKTFGLPVLLFLFLMANAGLYRDHALEKPDGDKPQDGE